MQRRFLKIVFAKARLCQKTELMRALELEFAPKLLESKTAGVAEVCLLDLQFCILLSAMPFELF